jgi:hypothetical protein
MIQFEKVSLTDVIVVVALSLALLLAIFYGQKELAMSIASGLLGYIGGSVKNSMAKKEGANNG